MAFIRVAQSVGLDLGRDRRDARLAAQEPYAEQGRLGAAVAGDGVRCSTTASLARAAPRSALRLHRLRVPLASCVRALQPADRAARARCGTSVPARRRTEGHLRQYLLSRQEILSMMTRCDNRSVSVIVEDIQEVAALTHPVRIAALGALRTPDSAAGVASDIGQSRQLVNYHLKELERAGLIVPRGRATQGKLRRAAVPSGREHVRRVASAGLGWRRPRASATRPGVARAARRARRTTATRRDACSSTAPRSTVRRSRAPRSRARSASPTKRRGSAFMTDYLSMLGPLLKKYGTKRGLRYRVAVAAYPEPGSDPEEET